MVEMIVDGIIITLFELLICFLVLNNKKED
jgi:hypothetical protein